MISVSNLRRILIVVFVLSCGPLRAEIVLIPKEQVQQYVLGLFTTAQVREASKTPGNRISNLVKELSKRPLFVDIPEPTDSIHRENYTAYVGVLNLRTFRNKTPVINDLYFLHELLHISQMPYKEGLTHHEWAKKMTDHEHDISFQTEFAVFFEFPELRAMMNFPEIYADRYLNDPKLRELYLVDPEKAYAMIQKEKTDLQNLKPVTDLSDMEFRSWYYGRTMELWTDVYGSKRDQIEGHMIEYYETLRSNPALAVQNHFAWLKSNSKDGTFLRDELIEYIGKTRTLFPISPSGVITNPFNYQDFCSVCERHSTKFSELVDRQQIQMTPLVPVAKSLLRQGVAVTVYSYIFPESESTFNEVLSNFSYSETYGEAFTRKQDVAHKEFIEAYQAWAKPVVNGLELFPFSYPSNGSSEALKDTIGYFKGQNPQAQLHVFYGEYDGPFSYAQGLNMKVVFHERSIDGIRGISAMAKPGDIFYLSQPSGIDGNVWPHYKRFIEEMEKTDLKVLIDLAYVGLVPHNYDVDVTSKNIVAVFFSLSKSFGVYYQRIGGAFFKFENPLLYGNMWFKNLLSLKMGTKLLKSYGVYELARRYQWTQTASINQFNAVSGLNLGASDVILLANRPIEKSEVSKISNPDYQQIYRGGQESGFLRVTLTPSISTFVEMNREAKCRLLLE